MRDSAPTAGRFRLYNTAIARSHSLTHSLSAAASLPLPLPLYPTHCGSRSHCPTVSLSHAVRLSGSQPPNQTIKTTTSQTNGRTHRRTDERTNGRTDEPTNRRTDEGTNGRKDEWTNATRRPNNTKRRTQRDNEIDHSTAAGLSLLVRAWACSGLVLALGAWNVGAVFGDADVLYSFMMLTVLRCWL